MTLEKTVSRTFNEYPDFEIGDIVSLKSGSPRMTIDAIGGSRMTCVWFIDNTYHRQEFDQGTLEKVAVPQP